MPRCCGQQGSCSCRVTGGRHVEVTGTGSSQDPFVIEALSTLTVGDTEQFDLVVTGEGTIDSPWLLTLNYAAGARLDGIPDVDAAAPPNGYVLAWDDALQSWTAQAPTFIENGVTVRNLATNPSGETNSTNYAVNAGTGGTAALSRPTTGGTAGTAHHRATWSVANTAVGGGIYYSNAGLPVTAGLAYSAAFDVRCSKAQTVRVAYHFVDSAGATISTFGGTAVALAANTWTRVSVANAVAPAGSVRADVSVYAYTGGSLWAAGDTLDVDKFMPEQSTVASTYGDGDTEGWEWTGTAHASTSGPRAVGAIATGNSIEGDGSPTAPLEVTDDNAKFITIRTTGVGLTDEAINRMIRVFPDATARAAATDPAPTAGTLSILATDYGRIEYFDGTAWFPIDNGVRLQVQPGEMLALSGPYAGGVVHQYIEQLVGVVTDASGNFTVLSTADLTGYAGVLSCHIQELGTAPWKAMLRADTVTGEILGTAYRADDGTVYAGFTLNAVVTAWLY